MTICRLIVILRGQFVSVPELDEVSYADRNRVQLNVDVASHVERTVVTRCVSILFCLPGLDIVIAQSLHEGQNSRLQHTVVVLRIRAVSREKNRFSARFLLFF